MDYMNTELSAEKRAELLLEKMTLKEKAAQMIELAYTGESEKWAELGIGSLINAYDENVVKLQKIALEKSRLKIPILFAVDCIHGHALNPCATVFPSQLAMAQSFNREALEKCAEVSGKESLTDGIPWVFSPVLCLGRDPRWGRIGETFGEDAYLAGELGAAMARGYKKAGVVSCAKHYIAHGEVVGGKDSYNVSVSDRRVKEYFEPVFKKVIDAGCDTVMSAQHIHDGQPFCENKSLINTLLKGEDKFDGVVITDNQTSVSPYEYGSEKSLDDSFRMAVEGGSDMLMFCSKNSEFYEAAERICDTHPEFLKRIDEAVLRILTLKFKIGLFEKPFMCCEKSELGSKEHIDCALEIAEQSISLLKNNGVLPIDKRNVKKIAVIGPAADNPYSQYGDWTYLNMPFSKNQHRDGTGCYTSYLKGITETAKSYGIETVYCKGCDIVDTDENNIDEAVSLALESDLVIAVVGDINKQNGEHHDRCHLGLTWLQTELLERLFKTGKRVVVILSNGRPHITEKAEEKADAILQAFNSGIMGGKAAARIIFGEVNPSGKLAVSIPKCEGQLPACYDYTLGWHADDFIDESAHPLYPFGYGLSYTKFEYSNLIVPNKINSKSEYFTVGFDLKNTGKYDGTEIVEVYIYQKQTSVLQPLKALKAFERVFLKAGESKRISINVYLKELAVVDYEFIKSVQSGIIDVMVGGSSKKEDLITATSEIV